MGFSLASHCPRAVVGLLSLSLGRMAPYLYKEKLPPPCWEKCGLTPQNRGNDAEDPGPWQHLNEEL